VVRGKSNSVVAGEQPTPPNGCGSGATPGAWDSSMMGETSPAPAHAFETRGGTLAANPSAPFTASPSGLPINLSRRPSFDGQNMPPVPMEMISVPINAVTQATQQPTAACAAPVYPSLDGAAADPALMMTATTGPMLGMGGVSAAPLMGGPATYLGAQLQTSAVGQPYLGSPAPQGQLVEGHAAAAPPGAKPEHMVAGAAPAAQQHTCIAPNTVPTVLPTALPTAPPATMSTVPPAAISAPASVVNTAASTITPAAPASIPNVPPVTVPTLPPAATASTVAPPTAGVAPAAVSLPTGANTGNPSVERRRKFAVQDNGAAAGAGGACRRAGTPSQDAAGSSMPPPVGITLPASYLPVAHLAAGRLPPSRAPSEASNDDSTAASVQSNADGALQNAYEAGYAEGHAKAVQNMSSRLDWLAHEWRAQQSLVQQIIANVSARSPGLDDLSPTQASLAAAQLAAGQNTSRVPSRRPSQESLGASEAEAELRAVCTGAAAGPSQTGGTAPALAAPPRGDGDLGAGAEVNANATRLAKLQLDVSGLLATNRKLRQDNLELLREIFP